MICGGAGGILFKFVASDLIIKSPGGGGVGGFKYFTFTSWVYSIDELFFLYITSGSVSFNL